MKKYVEYGRISVEMSDLFKGPDLRAYTLIGDR